MNNVRWESWGEEVDCSGYSVSPQAPFINPDDRLFKSPKNKRRVERESLTQRHYVTDCKARSNNVSLRHFGLKNENTLGNFQGRFRDQYLA